MFGWFKKKEPKFKAGDKGLLKFSPTHEIIIIDVIENSYIYKYKSVVNTHVMLIEDIDSVYIKYNKEIL